MLFDVVRLLLPPKDPVEKVAVQQWRKHLPSSSSHFRLTTYDVWVEVDGKQLLGYISKSVPLGLASVGVRWTF